MMQLRQALQRAAAPLQYRISPPLAPTRLLSHRTSSPSEAEIVCDLRRGDFARGILRFCKRPRASRSNALHETVILACAQVPDAAAAEAVLRAMPRPTPSAVRHVISALCRERNVPAAVDVLAMMPQWGLPLERGVVAAVMRAAQHGAEDELGRLQRIVKEVGVVRRSGLGGVSAAEFFQEDGGDGEEWLRRVARGGSSRQSSHGSAGLKEIMGAESALRSARGSVDLVNELWGGVRANRKLCNEVGVLAAAVSAYVSSGCEGGERALNVLMTWVREHLYDEKTGCGKAVHTENAASMALLVTTATKAIAAAARAAPGLALSAFDVLWNMNLPRFSTSLPLTGAYFKVLQHADLSLGETLERIDAVREHHIQLDEQGFSMALGAILRCEARVVDKLAEGREWTKVMRSAGIPLTVHTFNLFAGQLRYCNDPQMVGSLLADMTTEGVVPTPVTYGLVFSACVIPGEYTSGARKKAVPVSVWERVLEAMEEHRSASGVDHTANSRLSLARAYAHLGRTSKALTEFDAYVPLSQARPAHTTITRRELEDAYRQMIHNFAHCRECSSDGPAASLKLHEQMKTEGFPLTGDVLDSLIVACARTGKGQEAVDYAISGCTENPKLQLSPTGLKHLLIGLAEVCDPNAWRKTRDLFANNIETLVSSQLLPVLHKLVISFARNQHREVCDDIMSLTGLEIADLDYVVQGREFLRIRSHVPGDRLRSKATGFGTGQTQRAGPQEMRAPHQRTMHAGALPCDEDAVLPAT